MSNELYEYICALPVIDTHEHLYMPHKRRDKDPINYFIKSGYFFTDFACAADDEKLIGFVMDTSNDFVKRVEIFNKIWDNTENTSYSREFKNILKHIFLLDHNLPGNDLFVKIADKINMIDQEAEMRMITDAGIKAYISDYMWIEPDLLKKYIKGDLKLPSLHKTSLSLPQLCSEIRNFEAVQKIGMIIEKHITRFDELEECICIILKKAVERGAVAVKDQSAYRRQIRYDLVSKHDAETLFNSIMSDSRKILGWPEAKPLEDYLFHVCLNAIRELKIPVQLHTGCLAGIRNPVQKANVKHLANLFELYKDIKFDIFHASWPYMDDMIYIAKTYPNVYLDLCWVYMIDPIYAQELLIRSAMIIPKNKVLGFGGDYLIPEFSICHLIEARKIIASALQKVVDSNWMTMNKAKEMAVSWLFSNPNNLFELGFDDFKL